MQVQPSTPEGSTTRPYVMGGTHDIDKNWVVDVKKKDTLVVPRVLFDKVSLTLINTQNILDCIAGL